MNSEVQYIEEVLLAALGGNRAVVEHYIAKKMLPGERRGLREACETLIAEIDSVTQDERAREVDDAAD